MNSPVRSNGTRWAALLMLLVCILTASGFSATCNANPRLASSFIEGYYPADWTAAQWDTLYTNQKNACINHVIIQYTAQSDPGNMVVYYPAGSAVTSLGFTSGGSSDVIGNALTEADKAQYQTSVVVGLQLNETEWFSSAGNAAWLDNQLVIARVLANDIWSKYGSHASFNGWYLPFEVDNCQLQTSTDVNTFVDHFLGPLTKTLNNLNSSKPVYMSPAFDTIPGDGCGSLSACGTEWQTLLQRMKSNTSTNGYLGVIALQDGVGALLNQTSVLASWYSSLKNTIAAAQLPHPISLWANTEVYYDPNAANPMSLNLVVADMQAVQPYVAAYTSFTWAEFYNPQFVNSAYNATYLSYLSTGAVDGMAPTAPTGLTATAGPTGSRRIDLAWSAATDNFGVVAYRIYRNNSLLTTLYGVGTGNPPRLYKNSGLSRGVTYSYKVYAVDPAGNLSLASNTASATAR